MSEESIIEWHNDHHLIKVMLNKSNFAIDEVICPATEKDAACLHESIDGCLVRWFLMRYGFDCNVGVVPAASELEIAWTLVTDSLYDPEMWQVWIIPTSDTVFAAWLDTQNGDSSSDTAVEII
jgi:hypothetical protein